MTGRQLTVRGSPRTRVTSGSTRGPGASRNRANRRRAGIVVGVAACVALIGVPVGLLAASGPATGSAARRPQHHVTVSGGVAKRSVLAALSATTDSGNFAFSYQLNESPVPEQRIVPRAHAATALCAQPTRVPRATDVQGSGTINTNPMAMAASAAISYERGERAPGRGPGGSHDSVGGGVRRQRVDSGSRATPVPVGALSPGFAGLVEGTLGPREGRSP